jgi:Domain of unknown function (DUF3854)/Type III restriction enzyme, res subunit
MTFQTTTTSPTPTSPTPTPTPLEWADFINECVEGSQIRRELFDLNVERIIDRGPDETVFGDIEYATLDILNIPYRRFTEGKGDTWNRPTTDRFGGEIYAFISTRSGFFNCKPRCPQWDSDKGKPRKYEAQRKNPGEEGNKVFFPNVDQLTCDRLRNNFDIPFPLSLTPNNYWEVILSLPHIRVGITEGAKKALSLTDIGFPCVAILGVANWSISGSQPRTLLPELTRYCANRPIDIWFDREDPTAKIKSFLSVKSQARQLTAAVRAAGAHPKSRSMYWDLAWGKGIDDVRATLSRQQIPPIPWIWETITSSHHREIYDRIDRAYQLSPTRSIHRDTSGDYLPELNIAPGQITALIADTGSGKTYQIAQAIDRCRTAGQIAIVFAPTNKIGTQLAATFGIPHRNTTELRDDGSPMEQGDILFEARRRGGLVICPDSIDWALQLTKRREYIVVCDEAAKIAEHLSVGTTFKDRYALVTQNFANLLTDARSLIVAEAKLSEADIQFYEQISGKSTQIYRHRRTTAKREIKMYTGSAPAIRAALLAEICHRIDRGERILIPTDSQRLGETIEHYLQFRYPYLKGRRVDAHTGYIPDIQHLTRTPNQFLAHHHLHYLIFSPACKAGWDLTGTDGDSTYHFDAVCAFLGVLPTSDHIQMVARYRPAVPLSIACPEFISQSRDEVYQSTKSLDATRTTELTADRHMCGISPTPHSPLQVALDNLYIHNTVRNGLEKSIARYSLHHRALADGHTVALRPISMPDLAIEYPDYHARLQATTTALTKIGDIIDERWSATIASVQLLPTDDLAEAARLDRLDNPTPHDRAKSLKIRLTNAFPGVDFDDYDNAHHSTRKRGKLAKGATLHASLSYESLVAANQRSKNSALLQDPIFANHHLSHDLQRVRLLLISGILDLLEGEYSKISPELIALQSRCVEYAAEFKRYLGLDINVNQDPTEIYCKLLRKLGLEVMVRRDGTGARLRWYRVATLPRLEEAIDDAVSECEQLEQQLEIKEAQLSSITGAKLLKAIKSIDRFQAKLHRLNTLVIPRLLSLCTTVRIRSALFAAATIRLDRLADSHLHPSLIEYHTARS